MCFVDFGVHSLCETHTPRESGSSLFQLCLVIQSKLRQPLVDLRVVVVIGLFPDKQIAFRMLQDLWSIWSRVRHTTTCDTDTERDNQSMYVVSGVLHDINRG